ncbi:MAG: hypothetical protein ACM3ZC_06315 [Bacteroidota bacterium]
MDHPRRLGLLLALLGLALVLGLASLGLAAAPPAGAPIGNQATATYTDAGGVTRTVTSNAVITYVQQVAALTLTSSMTKRANPNSQVVFPLTLTNSGNGTDRFTLSVTQSGTDNYNFTSVTFYKDVNGDGVADDTIAIDNTGDLAAGAVFRFVAVAAVPSTPSAGQSGVFTVKATSDYVEPGGDLDVNQTIDETVIVTGNAVISVTKSISQHTAAPGNDITYTLTYTNSGNATATNLTLRDVIPAHLTYVAGSGRWSGSGTTDLDDGNVGNPAGISYQYAADADPDTAGNQPGVVVVIASVPVGSGTVSFHVTVDAGTPPGTIYNSAGIAYDDGGTPANHITGTTNSAPLSILQTTGVDVTGATVAAATQGATVVFTNTVRNTGNGTDSFELTVGNVSFPEGTTFTLYRSDGITPLLDADGDGIPDTGPLAAGATFTFVLKAVLPSAATGGPYTVNFTGRSNYNGVVADTAADTLTAITASSVDVTYSAALPGAPGAGAGPEVDALANPLTDPNTTVTYDLYVNNTSTIADVYDLQASTVSDFSSITLPAGWSVVYRNESGAVITRTGVIAAGGNQHVIAAVSIPAGTTPGARQIYFRAVSPTTTAADIVHLAVTVNTVHGISLAANNALTVYPGGAVTYRHTLTNTGNVAETVNLSTAHAPASAGFTSSIYEDLDNDGVIDIGEPVIASKNLALGASVAILVKVYSPAGAAAHTTDVCTLTASNADVTATVTDTTTVISADLIILKEQALWRDTNADNIPDTEVRGFSTAQITTGAVPGTYIRYKVTITNNGTAPATVVTLTDSTPAYTVYDNGDGSLAADGSGVAVMIVNGGAPAAITVTGGDGLPSTFTANVVTGATEFLPGQTAVIYFTVKIVTD